MMRASTRFWFGVLCLISLGNCGDIPLPAQVDATVSLDHPFTSDQLISTENRANADQLETDLPDRPLDETLHKPETSQPRPDAALPKPDAPKVDVRKIDSRKNDAPRPDAPRPDAPKIDTRRPDAPRPDAPKIDVRKPDAPRPDAPRPDAPKPDTLPSAPGNFILISSGFFNMGSPTIEDCREGDEDRHLVTLTHNFEIQDAETTQGDFERLMGYNPSYLKSCGSNCPVTNVTWHEAVSYCNQISSLKGYAPCYTCSGSGLDLTCQESTSYSQGNIYNCPGYRLPTDAEWEFSYRAGTTTHFYNGAINALLCNDDTCPTVDTRADEIAWYICNSNDQIHPVKQKRANTFGIYDMAGNVYEWCHDWYTAMLGTQAVENPWGSVSGGARVVRGGSKHAMSRYLRAADREYDVPTEYYADVGFRCARSR